MSFFSQEQLQNNSGSFEIKGGEDLPDIPKDTRVVAMCEEAKNDSHQGESYINLKWRINLPKEHANRVIFQKLRIFDAAKGDRAKDMLAAIAHNSGGKLFAAMQQSNEQLPSDISLMGLCNSPMVLLLDIWEFTGDDGKPRSGNWVKAVSAYNRQAPQQQAAPVAPQIQQPTQQAPFVADNEIPF